MMLEENLVATLSPLIAGQFYPDTAPADAVLPYAIWQQVGGVPIVTLEGVGSSERPRIQIVTWAASRLAANAAHQQLIRAATDTLAAELATGMVALREDAIGLYGCRQDIYLEVQP